MAQPPQQQQAPAPSQPDGMTQLLTTLASSGDNWVKLGTLVLVGLAGLGNWVATWNSSNRNREEIEFSRRVSSEGQERIREQMRQQIDDIHTWMEANRRFWKESTDEFHKGNEDSAQNNKILSQFKEELKGFEARQLSELNNQGNILKNQTNILSELHDFVKERQKQQQQTQ
jgi:hypothetical protein